MALLFRQFVPGLALWLGDLVASLRRPAMADHERPTYVRNLWFDLLSSAAAGILANAPAIALQSMGTPPWALSLRLGLSSIGMFAALYLGAWMGRRRKMPFVQVPGLAFAACSAAMAFTNQPLVFLSLFGVGAIFEVVTRPAVTAILRANYAPERRGQVIGHIRSWCSLAFLGAHLAAAMVLRAAGDDAAATIRVLMLLGAGLDLASFVVFSGIRPREAPPAAAPELKLDVARTLGSSCRVVARDGRFRQYLVGCFLFGFSGLMYVEFIPAFLRERMGFGYVGLAMLTHVIPGLAQFLTTGAWGRRFDRSTPNRDWGWVRLGWGLDPIILAVAPAAAAIIPAAAYLLPTLARISRGAVMGGSWVLWWRTGIAHFAPPGEDTSRYMGILTFLNGLMRLAAAIVGSLVLVGASVTVVLVLGGAGVILSGLYSWRLAAHEKSDQTKATIAAFEAQFSRSQEG